MVLHQLQGAEDRKEAMNKIRPALRYFGGKWKLAPWIISHFPEHRIYVEPFGGAASVLLQKPRCYAEVYNDIDDSVFTLFTVLKGMESSIELESLLKATPYSRREFELAHTYSPDPVEKSRRLIIRSFMGFGADSASQIEKKTSFRNNSNRSGTTPAHDWVNYSKSIKLFRERLAGVVIENDCYKNVISQHDTDKTLFYLDPPYLKSTRKNKHGYNYEFSDQDHFEMLDAAANLKGMVIISGYENDLYNEKLKGWNKVKKETYADGAKPRTEVLWIKC